jgi:hypothetical protein
VSLDHAGGVRGEPTRWTGSRGTFALEGFEGRAHALEGFEGRAHALEGFEGRAHALEGFEGNPRGFPYKGRCR